MKHKQFLDLGGERAVAIGRYVAETGSTVRSAARVLGISKSTAHKDLTVKLKEENLTLYNQARKVLEKNKDERHIRGGLTTKDKYMHLLAVKDNK